MIKETIPTKFHHLISSTMFKSNFYSFLLLSVLFISCNTEKDDIESPKAFSMDAVIGRWKIVSASAEVAGGVITLPNLFDAMSPLISGNKEALAFAMFGPNTIIEYKRNNIFEERSGLYATPPTTTEADFGTATGTYVANEAEGTLNIIYNAGSSPATLNRNSLVVSVNAKTLVIKFDVVNSGATATNTFTYSKLP